MGTKKFQGGQLPPYFPRLCLRHSRPVWKDMVFYCFSAGFDSQLSHIKDFKKWYLLLLLLNPQHLRVAQAADWGLLIKSQWIAYVLMSVKEY